MAPIRTRSRQSSVSLSPISPLTNINPLNSPPLTTHSDLEPPPYSPPGRSHSTPSLSALGLDLSPWATGAQLGPAPPAPPIPSRHSSASLASQHFDFSPPHSRQPSLSDHHAQFGHRSGSGWADDDGDQLEFGRRSTSGRPIRRRTNNQSSSSGNMARARNVGGVPESEPPIAVSRPRASPALLVRGGGLIIFRFLLLSLHFQRPDRPLLRTHAPNSSPLCSSHSRRCRSSLA